MLLLADWFIKPQECAGPRDPRLDLLGQKPSPNPHTCLDPNVNWGLWAYLRRQKIPRSDPSACSVFFPSCSRESGSEISFQPSCYPAVAGNPKSVVGQASVLLQEYLFFSPSGVGAERCMVILDKGHLLLDSPPGDWDSGTSGSRELRFAEHWLCPVAYALVTYVWEVISQHRV